MFELLKVIGVIALAATIVGFWAGTQLRRYKTWKRLRCYFQDRGLMTTWAERSSEVSEEEVARFIALFVEAFSRLEMFRDHLSPDDKVMKLYSLLNAESRCDAFELECFSMELADQYHFDIHLHWHDAITLGEIFTATHERQIEG